MRLRNIPGADERIAASDYVVSDPAQYRGRWKELFGNDNPIRMEIGMGKGRFITDLSGMHPEINYIGVELYTSVLLRAVQKAESFEQPRENLRFLCVDAKELVNFFAPGEVDRIYLNFSDPWPKDRHAKRRLPAREFLARYKQFLKEDGRIEFKTDNRGLFDFAVEEAKDTNCELLYVSYDLHSDAEKMKTNVMTEYEEKFSSIGNPICKYEITLSGMRPVE